MNGLYYPDWLIRRILRETRIIAMVGASDRWIRPSYFAMKYLQEKGYRVIPVNPRVAGGEILGERVYARLADIPDEIDVVDIFRRPEDAMPIVEDAISVGAKVVWMQLGVRNDEAAKVAEEAGLAAIMDRCMKIEFGRLTGELGWNGVNTYVITSRRNKRITA